MYRFHIKPIQPIHASPQSAALYKEIQEILQIDAVPLVFQYIANYERYFLYIWARMKVNLLSAGFGESCDEIRKFIEQATTYFETPSEPLSKFVHTIHPVEVNQLHKVVTHLDETNIKMMLLMIGVRESIKGIYQARQNLPEESAHQAAQTLDEIFQVNKHATNDDEGRVITKAERMLAPLYGNNALMVSHYPDFFTHIATEMEQLDNTEGYLLTRVGLEQLSFAYIKQFIQPLNCSFKEFMELTEGTGYVDEILYLLKDTFPSRFPHLALTTGVMKKALQTGNSSVTIR